MDRPRYLLVDGHSVIFAWDELRQMHSKQQRMAREWLAKRLQHFQDTTDWLVTLVFDGRGGRLSSEVFGNTRVIYSASGCTADAVIEQLVGRVQERETVTVVSADQRELEVIEGLGAQGMSPECLRVLMEEAERQWEATQQQVNRAGAWKRSS